MAKNHKKYTVSEVKLTPDNVICIQKNGQVHSLSNDRSYGHLSKLDISIVGLTNCMAAFAYCKTTGNLYFMHIAAGEMIFGSESYYVTPLREKLFNNSHELGLKNNDDVEFHFTGSIRWNWHNDEMNRFEKLCNDMNIKHNIDITNDDSYPYFNHNLHNEALHTDVAFNFNENSLKITSPVTNKSKIVENVFSDFENVFSDFEEQTLLKNNPSTYLYQLKSKLLNGIVRKNYVTGFFGLTGIPRTINRFEYNIPTCINSMLDNIAQFENGSLTAENCLANIQKIAKDALTAHPNKTFFYRRADATQVLLTELSTLNIAPNMLEEVSPRMINQN